MGEKKIKIDWNIIHDIIEKAFDLFQLIWKIIHPEQKDSLEIGGEK